MQLKSGPLIYQPVQYSTGGVGVITRMKQYEIISEYRKGTSFRKIASMLGAENNPKIDSLQRDKVEPKEYVDVQRYQ